MKIILKRTLLLMTIFLVLFFLLTGLIPYLKFVTTSTQMPMGAKRPKIIGHRGAAGLAPENTMASFRRALDIGVDMIELDVHLTKDRSLVVMHDSNTKRTTGLDGEIEKLTLEEIRALDAGLWFGPAFAGEKVPTFEECLELMAGERRTRLLVELKWPRKGVYKGMVDEVVRLVRQKGMTANVIIQSFEVSYLEEVKRLAPEIEIHQLLFGKPLLLPFYFDRQFRVGRFKPLSGVSSVNLYFIYLDQSMTADLKKDGIGMLAFTANSTETMRRCISQGADGIITDYPDLARTALQSDVVP